MWDRHIIWVHFPYTDQMEFVPNPPPPHPNPNTHPQGKKKKKERVCIDGGLNKLSLLERHNFVYFNDVTINTSCPYHNFGEND